MASTYVIVGPEKIMSPEVEAFFDRIAKRRGFWCECEEPAPFVTDQRGHSVDADCMNCFNTIQVG